MEVSRKQYDATVFYLETLYEGCDLSELLISEISEDDSGLYELLSGFKGRNIEDIRDAILGRLSIRR